MLLPVMTFEGLLFLIQSAQRPESGCSKRVDKWVCQALLSLPPDSPVSPRFLAFDPLPLPLPFGPDTQVITRAEGAES